MKSVLLWTPRGLGVAYALFLSLFALDVFGEGYAVGEAVVALLIHLLPTILVLMCLAVAWRSQRPGGLLFVALGLAYGLVFTRADVMGLLIIAAPLILIGVLFIWSGFASARTIP